MNYDVSIYVLYLRKTAKQTIKEKLVGFSFIVYFTLLYSVQWFERGQDLPR